MAKAPNWHAARLLSRARIELSSTSPAPLHAGLLAVGEGHWEQLTVYTGIGLKM
ncbi:MAG: hypothetical protein ABI627_19005 [Polyangiaceae bacterium]